MPKRKFTAEQHQAMAEMREAGSTMGQIADRFNCSQGTVYYVCLKLGAERPDNNWKQRDYTGPMVVRRGNHTVNRFTPEEDERILKLESEGHTSYAIAKIMSRPHNSVSTRLMSLARRESRQEGWE